MVSAAFRLCTLVMTYRRCLLEVFPKIPYNIANVFTRLQEPKPFREGDLPHNVEGEELDPFPQVASCSSFHEEVV